MHSICGANACAKMGCSPPCVRGLCALQEEITLMINEIDLDNDGEIDFEGTARCAFACDGFIVRPLDWAV